MSTCTWKDCTKEGLHKLLNRDDLVWGILCEEHNELFNKTIQSGDARKIKSCWVKAKGGAGKAAEELSKDIIGEMKKTPIFRKIFRKENINE